MGDGEELMRRIASAGRRVDPGLSDRDVERLVAGARRQRERRRATTFRAVLAVGAAAGVVIAGALIVHRAWFPRRQEVAAVPASGTPPVAERTLRLSDGSTAVPLDAETKLVLVEERPDHVGLSLERGRGAFEVTPRPKRTFTVRAGDVTVTVVGTAFTVDRVADRVGVAVQRGTVRVDWGTGSTLVRAGQSGWYPPLFTSGDRSPDAPKKAHGPRAQRGKTASLAAPGADKGAAAADLLLAADRARLAGHANEGAELLRQLLREHADDPRAPLAAFTLGRLLLMELGRPAEAAAAFAQARRLSPDGPFAEDALAREVEALGRAGLVAEARARAEDYQRLYPNGRRMSTVRTAGESK